MDRINPNSHSDDTTIANAAFAEREADAVYQSVFLAIHRMRGWTSETDLERQLGNGELALYGRFLMRGEDVSLSIWATGIECWSECELAPDWHPLRDFVDRWRDDLRAFYKTVAGDADDTLVLVGRWVDFVGNASGTLVTYVQHLVREEGVSSAPYTGGLGACDPSLGGAGFHLMLYGEDAKKDRATLLRQTRRNVLSENRRLGCTEEPVVEGVFWWSKDLSRADAYSIVITVPDEAMLLEVS